MQSGVDTIENEDVEKTGHREFSKKFIDSNTGVFPCFKLLDSLVSRTSFVLFIDLPRLSLSSTSSPLTIFRYEYKIAVK